LFYLSGNHRSMFTNEFKFTFNSRHIITQVFNHISILFQLSTKISIQVFLLNYKVIKLIQALASKLNRRDFSLGFDYSITDAIKVSGDVRHTDGYFSTDTNEPELRVGSYTTVNLNSSYQINQYFEAFVYARNLLDERAPVAKMADRSTGGVDAYLLEPREIGVGVRAKF